MLAFTAIYFLTNLVPIFINMVIGCKRFVKKKIRQRQLDKLKKEKARVKEEKEKAKTNESSLQLNLQPTTQKICPDPSFNYT